ncbi:MAG TPA: multicopper oxidase family protein [Longimicrobiales bacterium]|nr:multicopper oxidase family protein [Longimicrobiales bacterium]
MPLAGQERPGLAEPPVLEDRSPHPDTVEVVLTAAPDRVSLLPGARTGVLAFNGSVPGPTLVAEEGDHVVVHFRNRLSEPTTIHWHGLHLPWVADGSPFQPVEPGADYTYAFTVQPGTAGTYWYHPHPHERTTYQIGMGLFGAFIVRAKDDPLAGIPERLLVLHDNRFREDGSIAFPEPGTRQVRIDEENGREGDVVFVNGQLGPRLELRPGAVERWRVLNASGARVYRLRLEGHTLLHVGSDGGLFEVPVERDELVLANTERVELLVRGTGEAGSQAILQSLPYDRYRPLTRPASWTDTLSLMTLAYGELASSPPPEIPDRLRRVPAIPASEAATTRVMRLSQGRINGRTMDMARVDVRAPLGATEVWEIQNLVGMDHPFHLHGFRFQVISRNGEPVPYRSWKDSVNVPKRETVRFIVRYTDHPGKWMFHCHIVDHEDMGMMGVLEVVP